MVHIMQKRRHLYSTVREMKKVCFLFFVVMTGSLRNIRHNGNKEIYVLEVVIGVLLSGIWMMTFVKPE